MYLEGNRRNRNPRYHLPCASVGLCPPLIYPCDGFPNEFREHQSELARSSPPPPTCLAQGGVTRGMLPINWRAQMPTNTHVHEILRSLSCHSSLLPAQREARASIWVDTQPQLPGVVVPCLHGVVPEDHPRVRLGGRCEGTRAPFANKRHTAYSIGAGDDDELIEGVGRAGGFWMKFSGNDGHLALAEAVGTLAVRGMLGRLPSRLVRLWLTTGGILGLAMNQAPSRCARRSCST